MGWPKPNRGPNGCIPLKPLPLSSSPDSFRLVSSPDFFEVTVTLTMAGVTRAASASIA